jgi:hypothetical protein
VLFRSTIAKNLDQVKLDLSNPGARQRSEVEAIVAEVEKDNTSIGKLEAQQDLIKAVEAAKSVQTKIYHAQLMLAGQKAK